MLGSDVAPQTSLLIEGAPSTSPSFSPFPLTVLCASLRELARMFPAQVVRVNGLSWQLDRAVQGPGGPLAFGVAPAAVAAPLDHQKEASSEPATQAVSAPAPSDQEEGAQPLGEHAARAGPAGCIYRVVSSLLYLIMHQHNYNKIGSGCKFVTTYFCLLSHCPTLSRPLLVCM